MMNVKKVPTYLARVAKVPRRRASPGEAEFTERFHMRLNGEQHQKVLNRGGAAWVRLLIDLEP